MILKMNYLNLFLKNERKAFKFLRNKNYFNFYLEYTNLYPQCENLWIRFIIRDIIFTIYSKLQEIQGAIQYLSIISSLL